MINIYELCYWNEINYVADYFENVVLTFWFLEYRGAEDKHPYDILGIMNQL